MSETQAPLAPTCDDFPSGTFVRKKSEVHGLAYEVIGRSDGRVWIIKPGDLPRTKQGFLPSQLAKIT